MMVLRVKQGRNVGRSYPLDKDSVVIGRDNDIEVTIADEAASRRHAEVFSIGEMYFVKDLGSRNGTLVNDKPAEEELLDLLIGKATEQPEFIDIQLQEAVRIAKALKAIGADGMLAMSPAKAA